MALYLTHLLLENGEVYSWGWNNKGQLGHGNRKKKEIHPH